MTPASLAFSDIFANQTLCHIRHTPTGKNPNPRPLDLPPTFTRADNTERTLSANANTRATHPSQSTWVFNTQPAHSPAPYTRSSNNSKQDPNGYQKIGGFRPTYPLLLFSLTPRKPPIYFAIETFTLNGTPGAINQKGQIEAS